MRGTRTATALTLLVAATGWLAATGPVGPAQAFPGANGKLAFSAVPDGEVDREIFVYDPSTHVLTRLTDDTAEDSHPSWSPDGTRIAYSSNGDIFTMAANGSDPQLVAGTSADETAPAYSPFGNRIVYVRRGSSADLFTIGTDGSGRFRLTRDKGEENNPAWSPNGDLIAFDGAGDANQDIFTIKPNGNGQENLTDSDDNDTSPSWNPKGSKLAFARQANGSPGEDIWRMKASGKGQTKVAGSPSASDITPSWSPDGKLIAFVKANGGDRVLATTTLNGVVSPINIGMNSVAYPDWQRLPL